MKCTYCGTSSGLFSKKHKECEARYESGKAAIYAGIKRRLIENASFTPADATELAKASFIEDSKSLVVEAMKESIRLFLSDGALSDEEHKRFYECLDQFGLTRNDFDHQSKLMMVQANILRHVMKGVIPEETNLTVSGNLPFILEPDEKILCYSIASYYEMKTVTSRRGSYQGVSVPLFNGVYYKMGAFQSEPVVHSQMTLIAPSGVLCVTQKNIYFASPMKAIKIAFKKILALTAYSDAVGFQENRSNAKPKAFGLTDVWYVYNLIFNLQRL